MPIDTPHPEYLEALPRWQRCRDVAAGEDAVKAKGERYLPRPSGMDRFGDEYDGYLLRTPFYNAVERALDGHVGAVMQRAPEIIVPPSVVDWLQDITLSDVTLEQLAGRVLRETLALGRVATLVDYSETAARPYLSLYIAEDVVHWRVERRDGDEVLTRVVLRETADVPGDDPSEVERVERFRELALGDDGYYRVRLHEKLPPEHLRDPRTEKWVAGPWITPSRRGASLRFIPMVIFGPSALGPAVARPPLEDLAVLCLAHYRLAADLQHALHWTATPTIWFSGAKQDQVLRVGASVAWDLGDGGKAGMVEFSGAGVAAIQAEMQELRAQMATVGTRTLEDGPRLNETATGVLLRRQGEHANLRAVAGTVSQGLTTALQWLAWWGDTVRTPSAIGALVSLNTDFTASKMTPDELRAQLQAFTEGGISFETLHANLTRGDISRPGVSAEDERKAITTAGAA